MSSKRSIIQHPKTKNNSSDSDCSLNPSEIDPCENIRVKVKGCETGRKTAPNPIQLRIGGAAVMPHYAPSHVTDPNRYGASRPGLRSMFSSHSRQFSRENLVTAVTASLLITLPLSTFLLFDQDEKLWDFIWPGFISDLV